MPRVLPLLALTLALAACTTPKRVSNEAFGRSSNSAEPPTTTTDDVLPEGARRVAEPEEIPALDAPALVEATLAPDEEVAGVVAPSGLAVAVPLSVLAQTPIVNLKLDGVPVSVVLDAASGAVSAWVSSKAGLGATGIVVGESFVVHDRESLVAFVSLSGARVGSEGAPLVPFPVDVLPAGYWSALHPAFRVVSAPGDAALLAKWRSGVASSVVVEGVSAAAWVVGVVSGGVASAFEVSKLSGVREVEVGGEPLVLLPVPGGALVRVRRVDGRVASFEASGDHLVDRETGDKWTLDGRCFEGKSAGFVLSRPSLDRRVRWGAWRAAFPASDVR